MFCKKCGNKLPEGSYFCPKCGTKAENETIQSFQAVEQESRQDDNSVESKWKQVAIEKNPALVAVGIIVLVVIAGVLIKESSGGLSPNKAGEIAPAEEAVPAAEEAPPEASAAKEAPPAEETILSAEEEADARDKELKSTETVTPSEPAVEAEYSILKPSKYSDDINMNYSEGRAWVVFNDEGKNYPNCLGLIDENGTLLRSINIIALDKDFEDGKTDIDFTAIGSNDSGVTEVSDGTSCIYGKSGFMLIGKDGEILYSSDDNDETTTFHFCGCGDGKYLFSKEIKNYSDDETYFYMIDNKGENVSEGLKIDFSADSKFNYMGEGIFSSSNGYIYNSNVCALIDLESIINNIESSDMGDTPYNPYSKIGPILLPFYGGITLTSNKCIVSADDLIDEYTVMENIKRNYKERALGDCAFGYDEIEIVGEGKFPSTYSYYDESKDEFFTISGYFDYRGNMVVEMPELPDKVEIMKAGKFSGGYAPLALSGADGNYYFTLIDEKGDLQYEPLQVDKDAYNGLCSYHGYIWCDSKDESGKIITPDGRILKIGVDDLSEMGKDAVLYQDPNRIHISGGFILLEEEDDHYSFLSLDGKTRIDKVKEVLKG